MRRSLGSVYLMHSLNGLAGSFIVIFIPIYLLTLHYTVLQVFAYYLLASISLFLSILLTSLIARHIGLRKTLLAYLPFQFAYFGLLYALPHMSIPLWMIAITIALASSLYWYPLHLFFLENARAEEMGASVGKLYALPKFATLLSPLIGAYIVTRGGFSTLLLITIVLYFFSSLSLFYLPDTYPDIRFKFGRFLTLLRRYPRYVIAEIGERIREEFEGTVLPIIIFVTFGSIYSVGFIGTLLNLGTALFLIVVGRSADRFKRTNILRIGAILMMMLWAGFIFIHGQLTFYMLALAESFLGALLLVPLSAILYDYAQAADAPAEIIVFREIPIAFARIAVYSISTLSIYTLSHLFLLPALGSLLFFAL